MSRGTTIIVLLIFAIVGLVLLLIKLKVLPIESKKLQKILNALDRMPKLSS